MCFSTAQVKYQHYGPRSTSETHCKRTSGFNQRHESDNLYGVATVLLISNFSTSSPAKGAEFNQSSFQKIMKMGKSSVSLMDIINRRLSG